MDDLHSMFDYANSHQLFTIVPPVHHKRVGQTLHNWALGLSESPGLVSTSGVRHVDWVLGSSGSDVIFHGKIGDLYMKMITSTILIT